MRYVPPEFWIILSLLCKEQVNQQHQKTLNALFSTPLPTTLAMNTMTYRGYMARID